LGCLLTHPLCQQDSRACRPTISEHPHYLLFFFGLIHLLVFILAVSYGATTIEYKERYDDKCVDNNPFSMTFHITERMPSPVYFYYELDNFYQNHFRFLGSHSFSQLRGKFVENSVDCQPVSTENISGKTITLVPCGLYSRYMFNDTYILPEYFSEHGIAWPYQINVTYAPPNEKYSAESRWMRALAGINPTMYENETTNEHYITWMRSSNRPHFKKLYAISRQDVPVGDFTILVNCNYNKSFYHFGRYISLMSPGKLGGKNTLIWSVNLCMSVISSLFGLVFLYYNKLCKCSKGVDGLESGIPMELQEIN